MQKNNYTVFSVASFKISVKQSELTTKLSFNTSTYLEVKIRKTLMACLATLILYVIHLDGAITVLVGNILAFGSCITLP